MLMENLIKNIAKLIKIKSISGFETEIRDAINWLKTYVANDGLFIKEYDFEGASPALLLSNRKTEDFDIITIGHIDVVPAKDELFLPFEKDGRLYGRGGFDMKAAVMVNIEALKYAKNKNIAFGVLITTDEETSSNGMKSLMNYGKISAKVVFDNDSGDLYNLTEKYKHPVSVRLSAKGENAHSSRPWEGVNAVSNLIACIGELEKSFPRYGKENIPTSTWVDTMVITAINSPTTYNVVPNTAEARINFRLTEQTSLAVLEDILAKACKAYKCSFEVLLSSRGVYMDASNAIIQQYLNIAEEVIGHKVNVSHSCGATDSRMFADISTIIMHGTNGDNAHGDAEYVEIDSIYKLLEVQKKFIDEYINR